MNFVKMDQLLFHEIMEKPRFKFKRSLIAQLGDDPVGASSQIPDGVVIVKEVQLYIHCKFEALGDSDISKEFEKIYKQHMSFKDEFNYLGQLRIGQFLFRHKFENEEWARIILSRIHDNKFWIGEQVVDITSDLLHEVTRVRNKGKIPINEKNVKKVLEANTKTNGMVEA